MKESTFQRGFIEDLEELFPGCIIFKTDPKYIQGFPDLMMLYENRWAAFEMKKSEYDMIHNQQPNQSHYISMLDNMSFAAFVYPENKEEILDAIQHALRPSRSTRISRGK